MCMDKSYKTMNCHFFTKGFNFKRIFYQDLTEHGWVNIDFLFLLFNRNVFWETSWASVRTKEHRSELSIKYYPSSFRKLFILLLLEKFFRLKTKQIIPYWKTVEFPILEKKSYLKFFNCNIPSRLIPGENEGKFFKQNLRSLVNCLVLKCSVHYTLWLIIIIITSFLVLL